MPPIRSPEANELVIDRTASAHARSGSRRAADAPVTTSTTRWPGEIAKNCAQYLFPPIVEPRPIAAADQWLADAEQPPPLRRLVFEGRDGIARALRARERDADAGLT